MSEEFKRSEVGHDANDLHKHGGLIAPEEEKTERENLEDAIEALNESEETEKLVKIEKDMKGEAKTPVEVKPINEENSEAIDELLNGSAAAAEPINEWKTNKESKTNMNNEQTAPAAPKEAKKGGMGWKIATIVCLVLAIAGCGLSAYMLFGGDKVELMGRTITPTKTEKKEATKVDEPNTEEIATEYKFDFDSQTLNYSDLLDLIEADGGVTPYVIDYTKDGKYIYVIASVADGIGGYAGTYYREAKKGSSWKVLQAGHDFMNCSDVDAAKKQFMSDYKYIDDNLGSKFIGCYENGSVFPE